MSRVVEYQDVELYWRKKMGVINIEMVFKAMKLDYITKELLL